MCSHGGPVESKAGPAPCPHQDQRQSCGGWKAQVAGLCSCGEPPGRRVSPACQSAPGLQHEQDARALQPRNLGFSPLPRRLMAAVPGLVHEGQEFAELHLGGCA